MLVKLHGNLGLHVGMEDIFFTYFWDEVVQDAL